MNVDMSILLENQLFKHVAPDALFNALKPEYCHSVNYKKGETLICEGAPCHAIGIVLTGRLAATQFTPSGDALVVQLFEAHDVFALALMNEEKAVFPFSVVADRRSEVLFIHFSCIEDLLANNIQFNHNVISYLSTRMQSLKSKLQTLQHKDVRSRLITYLADCMHQAGEPFFELPHSKTLIAEILGVARPSVSRELHHMVTDGLLQMRDNNHIEILEPSLFLVHKKDF